MTYHDIDDGLEPNHPQPDSIDRRWTWEEIVDTESDIEQAIGLSTFANEIPVAEWSGIYSEPANLFETAEQAQFDAEQSGADRFGVFQIYRPIAPELAIDAQALFDVLIEHADYGNESAHDWLEYCGDPFQTEELTAELRRVFAAWLDKHDLRPDFVLLKNVSYHGGTAAE